MMRRIALLLLLSTSFAGCGLQPESRAVTGYGWGAAAGTLLWLPIGAPGLGFVVGGTLGAATGALTAPEYLYFGDVPWEEIDYSSTRVVPYNPGIENPFSSSEPKTNPYVRRPVNAH